MSNYAIAKELDHASSIDTLISLLKKILFSLEAEVAKLDINKLGNVRNSLNNLKTKIDDLNVGKSKTVSVDLKTLSNVVDNEVVKNTKFNTLINNLERKILDGTTLIHINQYDRDRQNLEKKIENVDKKYQIQLV